jgi:zinc transport system substrate-binding protein
LLRCLSISFLWLAFVAGIGCDRSAPKAAVPTEKVNVGATVYPLADVARVVGGPYVTASWIVETGQSLQGVQGDSEARNRLRSSDLIVTGGASEPWASEGYSDPIKAQRIIRLDTLPCNHDKAQVGLLWLDPVVMQDFSRELSARLTVLRPKHAAILRDRAADYVAQLQAVIDEYEAKLSGARTKKVLVLSNDFNPLLQRFGLSPVLVVEASPTQMRESDWGLLKAAVREQKTRLLLVPTETPAGVKRDLEQRAGVQVVPIDTLGTSAAAGRNTYLEILRYDLEQLLTATAL